MDLIRTIVLAIRDHEGRPSASEVQTLIDDSENGVFGYHITLLIQGDLLTGVDTSPRKDRYGLASLALTWAGHNFADNVISDEVWAGAKQSLDGAGLPSASFDVWTQVAVAKVTERLAGA